MSLDAYPKNYNEQEDFKCRGDPEPSMRSQDIIYHTGEHKWHIKVTFIGTMHRKSETYGSSNKGINRKERGRQLREFIQHINLDSIPLMADTVTEVRIEPTDAVKKFPRTLPLKVSVGDLPAENEYRRFSRRFSYRIMEDSAKILYPPVSTECAFPTVPFQNIIKVRDIAPAVSVVHLTSDKQQYVLKAIERPLYQPQDSHILDQELRNLTLMSQSPGIVQLVCVVTSGNPYQTGLSKDESLVVRGFLLEYHTGGTLEEALDKFDPMQRRWPMQIARGLQQLHRNDIAHMDVKPSNIVIDSQGNAIIIDISGLATTPEWTAPELRQHPDPTSLPWKSLVHNDIWAFGKLLELIAKRDSKTTDHLLGIVNRTTKENPEERLELRFVISELDSI